MFQKSKQFKDWTDEAKSDASHVVRRFEQQVDTLSPNLRKACFAALEQSDTLTAETRDAVAGNGTTHDLAGIPYLLQDLFDVNGWPTSCGAPFKELSLDAAEADSFLYTELKKRGAICFGKTPPSEFGVDPSGVNPTFGDCPHPTDKNLALGGGAGSSAHAVRNGYVPLAFGLDTYGGIRIPAAFQGLFAFRMEPNRYARDGVFPITPSMDSVGFFTNTIHDLEVVFQSLYGIESGRADEHPRGCVVPDISGSVTSEIKSGILKLVRHLDVEEDLSVSTSLARSFQGAKRTLNVILSRELYSVHRYWMEEYATAYEPHLLQFIENGRDCSPSAAESASESQQNIRAQFTEIFQKYDYIVMPISSEANPTIEEWNQELEDDIIQLIAPVSLAGIPAIVLPFSCDEDRYSAAQIMINPHKLHLIPSILEQAREYYSDEILELPYPSSESESLKEDIDIIDGDSSSTF